MKSKFGIAVAAAATITSALASVPADAQYYQRYDQRTYNHRAYGNGYAQGYDRAYYDGRTYRGRDASYYRDCRRSSGTTGLLAGGAGGALIGSALGGGTLGTVLGALGGGLLGKHLDKQHDAEQNYRNGC